MCVCAPVNTTFLNLNPYSTPFLHELVHIVHGNHSAAFYEMLDELVKEAESVEFRQQHNVSDIEGRYWGQGQRLGGGRKREGLYTSSSNPPAIGEGKRLGGSRTFGLSAKEAARQATLRRMQDKICCGTHDEDEVQFVPPPPPPPSPPATAAAKPIEVISLESPQCNKKEVVLAKRVILDLTGEGWTCPRCTFENIEDHLQCFFCFQVKS